MVFCYLSSPFFLQCYEPRYNSFKIVFDLQLIKATDFHQPHRINGIPEKRDLGPYEDTGPYEDPGPYGDSGPYEDPGSYENPGPQEDPGTYEDRSLMRKPRPQGETGLSEDSGSQEDPELDKNQDPMRTQNSKRTQDLVIP